MAAKQKHRTAGNSYNLRRKVEIPIELQLNNDNTFLNEFASQPELGQSSKSRSDTDTDSNTSIDLEIGTLLSQESEDSVDESPVHAQTKKCKKSDRPSRFKNSRSREVTAGSQPDQTLINERILSQLDAIGKRLTAIEQSSASAARPKAKKVTVRDTASSSLNGSFSEGDSVKKLPELHTLRHDRSIQDQVEARIRQLSNNDVKGTDPKYKFKKRLTLGIVDKATWQPDYVQENVAILCKNQKFVDRYVFNSFCCRKTVVTECQASRNDWMEWFDASNSYKPVVAGKSFADVVRANLGQKGHGQATTLVGTQVASKPGEPLELFKEGAKLSQNMPHQPFKQKTKFCKTTENCPSENIIVCKNRFEPLMEENLFLDHFDTLKCEIQAVGTAPGDTGPNVSSYHNENLQDCDKFDRALLKKRVAPSVIRQAKNCPDYVACKNRMGESFGVIPLSTLRKYEGPETKNQPISDPLQLHKSVKQFGCPNFLGARIPVV